jgi:hypothetical protein
LLVFKTRMAWAVLLQGVMIGAASARLPVGHAGGTAAIRRRQVMLSNMEVVQRLHGLPSSANASDSYVWRISTKHHHRTTFGSM